MGKRHQHRTERDLQDFVAQIDTALLDDLLYESDRGCVLVGCGFVEEALGFLLQTKLKVLAAGDEETPSEEAKDIISWILYSEPLAPAGSFANRIKFLRALGVINDQEMQALAHLKSLRNRFAHRQEMQTALTMGRVEPVLGMFEPRLAEALRECARRGLSAIMQFDKDTPEPGLSETRRLFIYTIDYALRWIASRRQQIRLLSK